ncbi:MAG TPA: hypothetical protein VE053_14515 [Allosphingosinicella sp.]|nr:hypothetical protein [Allosphingosinicella sp.]
MTIRQAGRDAGPEGRLKVRSSGKIGLYLATGSCLLCLSLPSTAQMTAEEALARSRVLPSLDPCGSDGAEGDIIVCGRRGEADRYRMPRTGEDDPSSRHRRVPGEVPRASAEPLSFAHVEFSRASAVAASGRAWIMAMAEGATR